MVHVVNLALVDGFAFVDDAILAIAFFLDVTRDFSGASEVKLGGVINGMHLQTRSVLEEFVCRRSIHLFLI